MAGYDTASLLTDSSVADGVKAFGTPEFFIRYFNPCPDTSFSASASNAKAEAGASWGFSAKSIGAISSPGDLTAGSAAGQADAQTFAVALQNGHDDVSAFGPVNNVNPVICWIDEEAGASLGANYIDAWSGELSGWNWKGGGTYPLFGGIYCDPGNPSGNCDIIEGALGLYYIWSNEPECVSSNPSVSNPPSWQATSCSGQATKLWQFAEPSACGYSENVDMDNGAPGFDYYNYCLILTQKP